MQIGGKADVAAGGKGATEVVTRVTPFAVSVAFEEDWDPSKAEGTVTPVKVANTVIYDRMTAAMDTLPQVVGFSPSCATVRTLERITSRSEAPGGRRDRAVDRRGTQCDKVRPAIHALRDGLEKCGRIRWSH